MIVSLFRGMNAMKPDKNDRRRTRNWAGPLGRTEYPAMLNNSGAGVINQVSEVARRLTRRSKMSLALIGDVDWMAFHNSMIHISRRSRYILDYYLFSVICIL
jgi:hypothetical protein